MKTILKLMLNFFAIFTFIVSLCIMKTNCDPLNTENFLKYWPFNNDTGRFFWLFWNKTSELNIDEQLINKILNISNYFAYFLILNLIIQILVFKESCGMVSKQIFNYSTDSRISYPYIIGGIESAPNSWPWMVAIFRRKRFLCGGTIINSEHILTAAHCVARGDGTTVPSEQLMVMIGNHNLALANTTINSHLSNNENHLLIPVQLVIKHPSYTNVYMQNDIALLKLSLTLNLDSPNSTSIANEMNFSANYTNNFNLQPICLPTTQMDRNNFDGWNSTIIGWGHQSEGGSISKTLREVQIPIISNEQCAKAYDDKRIRNEQICAHYNGGRDSCQGDSGGPLIIHNQNNGRVYQLGIVSWGRGCARSKYPGVYTRVSKYVHWIIKQIRDQSDTNVPNSTTTVSPVTSSKTYLKI